MLLEKYEIIFKQLVKQSRLAGSISLGQTAACEKPIVNVVSSEVRYFSNPT